MGHRVPGQPAAGRQGPVSGQDHHLPPDLAKGLAKDPNLTVLKGLYAAHKEIQFTIKGDTKPWHDVRVRQAISSAIDRQDVIDKVFDVDKAKSLMQDAGFGGLSMRIQFIFQNLHYEQRTLPHYYDLLLAVTCDFSIVIDLHVLYEEHEFRVLEFAEQLSSWLARSKVSPANLSYESVESEAPDLVWIRREGEFWKVGSANQQRVGPHGQ